MNIEDIRRMAKSRVEVAQKTLADFGKKLQDENVLQAVEWSHEMYTAGGDLRVWKHIAIIAGEGAVPDGVDGVKVVLDELQTFAIQGASRIPSSSSFTGNRYDLECTRAYAEAYRELERRDRNARERAEAHQNASGTPA